MPHRNEELYMHSIARQQARDVRDWRLGMALVDLELRVSEWLEDGRSEEDLKHLRGRQRLLSAVSTAVESRRSPANGVQNAAAPPINLETSDHGGDGSC